MPPRMRPIAAVLTAAVLFGSTGTALELGPEAATPLGVGAVRILIGATVLWLAILVGGSRRSFRSVRSTIWQHRWLGLLGGLGVTLYTPLFLAAVGRTGVAIGTVVAIASGPFFAGAIEWVARSVRPNPGWAIGTVVTVGGGALLVSAQSSDAASSFDVIGVIYALAAGFGYALYSVTAKATMSQGLDPTVALAAPFSVGAVLVGLLAIREPYGWLSEAGGALMAAHLGVAATGVAYLLFAYGLSRLTSATTVTLVLAEPLTATMLAVVVLDESLVALGWLGVAVLVGGLLIVGRTAEVSIEPVHAQASG